MNPGRFIVYTRILVPIDGSETSAHALDTALQLAREHDAALKAIYVVDVPQLMYSGPGCDPSLVRDAFVKESVIVLADAAAKMLRAGVKGSTRVLEVDPLGDDIAQRITVAANEFAADLVVMGTHGRRGWRRLVLGSVAERFLRISTRPVLLIPLHAVARSKPRDVSIPEAAGTTS
jgi:nucleotide-binding universal stress UspA family protein